MPFHRLNRPYRAYKTYNSKPRQATRLPPFGRAGVGYPFGWGGSSGVSAMPIFCKIIITYYPYIQLFSYLRRKCGGLPHRRQPSKTKETHIIYERKERQEKADKKQAGRHAAKPVHEKSRQTVQLQTDIQGTETEHTPGEDAGRRDDRGHGVGRHPCEDGRKLVQAQPERPGAGGQVHTQAQREEQLCARRRHAAGVRSGAQLAVGTDGRPRPRNLHGTPAEAHQGGHGDRNT